MRRFDVWVGRLAAIAGIVYVVLCSLWPLSASSAEADTQDRPGAPYFFVDSDDPTTDRLPLKSTQVDVKIAGVIADVVVTQRYRNEGKRPIEARYVFPGGTRSAVYAMNVRLGDRLLTANIREKQQARVEYEAAKSEGRTAALLEQHRPNVFQMNVAHIMPGDDVAVELHYTELIVPQDGKYQFVFPTVVGPRYNGAPATPAAAVASKWASMPFLPAGTPTPAAFDLHVALASPIGVKDVGSNTHVVDVMRAAKPAAGGSERVDIALAKGEVANDRDFVLDYRLAGDAIESGVLLQQGSDENYFLAMIEPPKHVAATAIVPREYMFVIDISGSMHGYPLDTAKALLAKLIGNLRPSDTFNVLLFSGDNSVLAPQSLPATQANIALAIRTIDRQSGGGSTELLPALRRALAIPKDSDRSRTMIVITDGYVTVEREAFELVSRNLGRANLFAFGIGSSVNRQLIEGLARAGQGEPFLVMQSSDAAAEAERFRKMIDAPVLTQVRLRFEGDAAFAPYDIEPVAIGDLFASRPVVVFGKWKGKPGGKLIVEGLTANGNFRSTVDLADEAKKGTDHPALRYLWARHRIASLSDQEALEGGGVAAKAITELGLRYSLLTQYTSFIAVDRIVRNTTPDQAVAVDQPSPMPQGVSNLAIGAEVPATPEPPTIAMLLVALALIALFGRRVVGSRIALGD
jgi:Ca-activated chloride channel family protein